MWGSYYGAFSQMEPHGNLQLHPNHPTVCPVSDICFCSSRVFTSVQSSLLVPSQALSFSLIGTSVDVKHGDKSKSFPCAHTLHLVPLSTTPINELLEDIHRLFEDMCRWMA